jgi:hypothetical protein
VVCCRLDYDELEPWTRMGYECGQPRWVGISTHRAEIVTLSSLPGSNKCSIRWSMSTPDQLLYSALHGTAMRYAAERRNLDESIEELRQIADGRNDILAEAAGITAGSWYASPATHVGYELIGSEHGSPHRPKPELTDEEWQTFFPPGARVQQTD